MKMRDANKRARIDGIDEISIFNPQDHTHTTGSVPDEPLDRDHNGSCLRSVAFVNLARNSPFV
jgi:hypothetical protein